MKTILVVDDEEMLREILADFLSEHGFHVLKAPEGESAFEILKKEPVDIVIADLKMPRCNGLQLTAKIRGDLNSSLPVILMSGHGEMSVERAKEFSASGFLPKPFSPSELVAMIRRLT